MSSIATDLAELLSGVRRAGDFYTAGRSEIFAPGIEVEGVGPIALPLLPAQAEQLVAVAERAPYGRGELTLVDTDVRRTWQIDVGRIRIRGRAWERNLADIIRRVGEGLGVAEPISAELYKLLVYDEGSFFASHRDTEKLDGMFATLVVALPSIYDGGELVVRHHDREARLDLRCEEPSEAGFAAFYADCRHEVLPVTEGCRLTLIYNLRREGAGALPKPPSYVAEQDRLAAALRDWIDALERGDDAPEKLVYPLEHAYTPAGMSFDALKGSDAARAGTLRAAAEAAGCDLHLALVSIEESGIAEHVYGDYYSRRHGGDPEEEFEVVEVSDSNETLSDWQRPDGTAASLGALPIEEGEASPPDALEELTPDEESFHEATGNEGASFERSYRLAALVLWPIRRRLAVLNQGGLRATLPYLAELTDRWAASGGEQAAALWAEAHELSGHMLATWPTYTWSPSDRPREAAVLLGLLTRLGDAERIDAFLAEVSAGGRYQARADDEADDDDETADGDGTGDDHEVNLDHDQGDNYDEGDNAAIVAALHLLPAARAAELVRRIVVMRAAGRLGACAALLAEAAASGAEFDLLPAAQALLAALEAPPAERPYWRRRAPPDAGLVVAVLTGLGQIDPALAVAAVAVFLSRPEAYQQDKVLAPAALALRPSTAAAVARLNDAVIGHLRRRIALPLTPPENWARPATLGCACKGCRELNAFLADPVSHTWHYKAGQHYRSHLESAIANAGCDVDFSTLRRGSPHTLVCTKNQVSYERRAKERQEDLANLALLELEDA